MNQNNNIETTTEWDKVLNKNSSQKEWRIKTRLNVIHK